MLLFTAVVGVPVHSSRQGLQDRSYAVVVHGSPSDQHRLGHLRLFTVPPRSSSGGSGGSRTRDQPVVYDEYCLDTDPSLVHSFWKTLLRCSRRRRLRHRTRDERTLPWLPLTPDDPGSRVHIHRMEQPPSTVRASALVYDAFKQRRVEAGWKMLDCFQANVLNDEDLVGAVVCVCVCVCVYACVGGCCVYVCVGERMRVYLHRCCVSCRVCSTASDVSVSPFSNGLLAGNE
jgi:hypothetical protein